MLAKEEKGGEDALVGYAQRLIVINCRVCIALEYCCREDGEFFLHGFEHFFDVIDPQNLLPLNFCVSRLSFSFPIGQKCDQII